MEVTPDLIEALTSNDLFEQERALRIIINVTFEGMQDPVSFLAIRKAFLFITSSERNRERISSTGVIAPIARLLNCKNGVISMMAAWALSNMCAGSGSILPVSIIYPIYSMRSRKFSCGTETDPCGTECIFVCGTCSTFAYVFESNLYFILLMGAFSYSFFSLFSQVHAPSIPFFLFTSLEFYCCRFGIYPLLKTKSPLSSTFG
jgi:hypothetical protein